MALAPPTLPRLRASAFTEARVRLALSEMCSSVRPLLPAASVACLSYFALALLLFSSAIRVFDAGWLPYSERLWRFATLLVPDALLNAEPDSTATLWAVTLYIVIAAAMCGSWWWALRRAKTLHVRSALPLIGLTAIVAAPLLMAPGLTSDDVYLYNLYGRAIAVYDANPVLWPPSAFPSDPHLPWVYWSESPSAYGPIWLMLSGLLSGLAGESISAVVVLYRVAGLGLHLVTVGVLWNLLRRRGPSTAGVGAIFYAWNPLVLLETVANAHNDVLVAVFAIALVGAAAQRRWSRAAVYAACAAMVKPFAVVLAPSIVRHLWRQPDPRARCRHFALAALVGLIVMVALNVPFWSGDGLIRNALRNPAATMYTNTLWELATVLDSDPLVEGTEEVRYSRVDLARGIAFLGGMAWVLTRRSSGRDVAQTAVRAWLVFCLTACWVWPWYFVPLLALAPLAGAEFLPTATALTLGGVLFWAAWPERYVGVLQPLYAWRSLLLFGPLILTWIWAPARDAWRAPAKPVRLSLPRSKRVGSTVEARTRGISVEPFVIGDDPGTRSPSC